MVEKVMAKVEEFYMGDEEGSGEAMFNAFVEQHKDKFTTKEGEDLGDLESMEGKLEWTQIHKEYQQFFEAKIESIITECGVSVQEFFNALKTEYEADPSADFYVEMLLSVSDYQQFMLMVRDYKKAH